MYAAIPATASTTAAVDARIAVSAVLLTAGERESPAGPAGLQVGGPKGDSDRPKLHVRPLRFADRRPYLTAEGKAAISIPRLEGKIKDSGVIVGRGAGRASAPIGQISSAINQVSSTKLDYKIIGQPTSWLCAAMAEEDDHLRRLLSLSRGLSFWQLKQRRPIETR
jgi:hypothetical protein